MFFLPRKDLHGLTALSISVTPPVLPLSLPGHSIAQTQWLWCFHASCAWGVFDLQSFVYAIAMLLSQEGQGRIQGVHNSVCLCNLTMNELLSRWAFIQSMALIPICLGISPALPKQSSYFPAYLLQLHRIWSCQHVPSLPLLCGLWEKPVCLSCCAAGWPAQPATGAPCSHWAGRTLQTACSVTNTLLWCHHAVPLHCTYSAELLYSVRNPAHHLPASSFPHYDCFFWVGGVSWCWLPNYSRKLWLVVPGRGSVRFHHVVAILYGTCKCLTSCILDSSGHSALLCLWKHMDKVNRSL